MLTSFDRTFKFNYVNYAVPTNNYDDYYFLNSQLSANCLSIFSAKTMFTLDGTNLKTQVSF